MIFAFVIIMVIEDDILSRQCKGVAAGTWNLEAGGWAQGGSLHRGGSLRRGEVCLQQTGTVGVEFGLS